MDCHIEFPKSWITSSKFEDALKKAPGLSAAGGGSVLFRFPIGCKLMIDVAIRLLSLINQLAASTRRVRLQFDDEAEAMQYLNRMGFFDELNRHVEVVPERPALSTASIYRGHNDRLVEIAPISRSQRDEGLPSRLTDTLTRACGARTDRNELGGAAWTIFAELVDNVFSHSETALDGYAALQCYPGGDQLIVAVSDSGLGIMRTLRPSLQTEFPRLVGLTDLQLLVEVFRQGISRHGAARGCGLKGSAAKAMKFQAKLDIRLPNQRVQLVPSSGAYVPNTAYCYDNLPLIWGTHIAFQFKLN